MTLRKTIPRVVAITGLALVVYVVYYAWQVVTIGAAYKAKILCSSVFVSGRDPRDVLREDLEGPIRLIHAQIDFDAKAVTASFPGVESQQALFRNGLGCTVLAGATDTEVRQHAANPHLIAPPLRGNPNADAGFRNVGKRTLGPPASRRLTAILDKAFAEPDPEQPVRTRAIVIVYDDQIVGERYAPGISPDTALAGWSMTKSVASALVGILVKTGRLSLDKPVRIAEWSGAGDPRSTITLDNLLRMSSGLAFDETSGPVASDVNRMLLRSRDVAAYAMAKPLQHEPGSHWYYSSGTTNIIARLIRDAVDGSMSDYHAFPRSELFDRIGMTSAIIETDAAGTFVGSSFMYATARDWARFGLLYLHDGAWEGERILPEGWVSYSATPSPAATGGQYGAHFWTNGTAVSVSGARPLRGLPADTFYASGYEGQSVVVIPSRKLVVVRLGQTRNLKAWDLRSFLVDVLAAIDADEPA